MRVFVTGANGFIGSGVVQELIGAGHSVVGLARSDAAAKALTKAGAQPHRGSLDDPGSLRAGASAADGVIHLAFMHGFSKASIGARLRVLLGGRPGGIVARFTAVITEADRNAIDALGGALESSGRPLVVTFGTMGLVPSGRMTEDDAPDPRSPVRPAPLRRRWCRHGRCAGFARLSSACRHRCTATGILASFRS